jgi:Fe(3+) dicitrate transport protein
MKLSAARFILQFVLTLGLSQNIIGQTIKNDTDSSKWQSMKDVTIIGRNSKSDYQPMPEIVGTNIYAGKKSALIVLENVQGNIANNTMRQVLAKVPGIHIWESDPSGIQIGIAARGLSPNRSWEFNIRQNGYDISADPFGYPEAYYNPQLQAVQRIEIVRGQGALQYGPQFGGMVNYILKNGSEINKPFEFETQQTIGSNGLINSFNAIGGKKGKINYYTFYDQRNGDGWRNNSEFFDLLLIN